MLKRLIQKQRIRSPVQRSSLQKTFATFSGLYLKRLKGDRQMLRKYKGWIIEKIEDSKHYNIRRENESNWTDAAELLRDAKHMIDLWEHYRIEHHETH